MSPIKSKSYNVSPGSPNHSKNILPQIQKQ